MGLRVLDSNGNPIQLENDKFTISSQGNITDENGVQVAQLGVAFSANTDVLMKQDNGLFRMLEGEALPSAYEVEGVTFGMQQAILRSIKCRCIAVNDEFADSIPCIRSKPKSITSV